MRERGSSPTDRASRLYGVCEARNPGSAVLHSPSQPPPSGSKRVHALSPSTPTHSLTLAHAHPGPARQAVCSTPSVASVLPSLPLSLHFSSFLSLPLLRASPLSRSRFSTSRWAGDAASITEGHHVPALRLAPPPTSHVAVVDRLRLRRSASRRCTRAPTAGRGGRGRWSRTGPGR